MNDIIYLPTSVKYFYIQILGHGIQHLEHTIGESDTRI
jgi:hypothetical protein